MCGVSERPWRKLPWHDKLKNNTCPTYSNVLSDKKPTKGRAKTIERRWGLSCLYSQDHWKWDECWGILVKDYNQQTYTGMRGETHLAIHPLVCFDIWMHRFVSNFILRISALVMLSLLGCALAQDRTFSWNGRGEPSQNDTNENGDLKCLHLFLFGSFCCCDQKCEGLLFTWSLQCV